MARPQRKRPEPRNLTVIKTVRITPNMHRITLGGEGLKGFPQHSEGGYVKFRLGAEGGKPAVRTYTIRSQTKDTIDVDFALHGTDGDSGPATNWALSARVGDSVMVGGPGPAKPLPDGSGPFLLIGDMTALPAISVNLENLESTATAHAIILIRDEADKQALSLPKGATIEWITEENLGSNPALLSEAARKMTAIDTLAYAWVACEFEAMKRLRAYLRGEKALGKEQLYISSYWKRGLVEDEHKQAKRADAMAEA